MDFADSPWLWDSGTPQPSFERDFARDKELDRGGTGPAITFTRASNATYFDSGGILRLAPHNLLQRSEEFDNASWTKTRASVTANAIAAPDGATTADKLVENTDNNTHFVYQARTTASNETVTLSVFAKAGERSSFLLELSNFSNSVTNARFDLTAKTAATPQSSGADYSSLSSSITEIGNGWFRCVLTATKAAVNTVNNPAILLHSGTSSSYTGDGTSGLYIWGAQLVSGSQAGEYFRTTDAAASMPRFDHDPATGASRGLLIEESRTNLLSGNSQNLTGTGWSLGAATLDSAVVDPAGNTGTVYYVSGGFERVCNFAGTGTQVVLSFFAKQRSGGGNIVRFEVFSSTVGTVTTIGIQDFNFTGSPAGAGYAAFSNVTRTELPNGWFRFSAVATAAGGFTSHSRVDIEGGFHSNYVWGIQVESGAFPTSYIPTTSATATRSADSAVVTPISSFYNQSEGTMFCESASTALVAGDNQGIWGVGDNALSFQSANTFYATYVSNRIAANAFLSGASQLSSLNNTSAAQSANTFARSAVVYKQDDCAISTDGSAVATDTSAAVPPMPTGLSIGSLDRAWASGGNHINGWIKKFAYYPKRLSNTLLQNLTA